MSYKALKIRQSVPIMKAKVEFGEDYIRIYDTKGEIVYWDEQEWKEEPEVVYSIANAVRLAERGRDLRKILKIKK